MTLKLLGERLKEMRKDPGNIQLLPLIFLVFGYQ